jgi:hypothetical protein
VDGPAEGDKRPQSARARFLKLGREAWKGSREYAHVRDIVVSPDGLSLAFVSGGKLIAGPLSAPEVVDLEAPPPTQYAPTRKTPPPKSAGDRRELHPTGSPSWSADSRFVYFATAGGRMCRYAPRERLLETLTAFGRSPVPLPDNTGQIVYLRPKPGPKIDPNTPDPVEVVVGDVAGKEARVVLADGGSYKFIAVSPDGKRLALVSASRKKGGQDVYVVPLAGGVRKELEVSSYGRVCWTSDSKNLVYVVNDKFGNSNLFLAWGGGDGEGTPPLTCGGGFSSPTVSANGDLFFMASSPEDAPGARRSLRQVPLATARDFARANAEEEDVPKQHVKSWVALLIKVFEESKVPADAKGDQLPPDALTRLDETFRKFVREQFKEEVPDRAEALDRYTEDLRSVRWPKELRPAFVLVLGAVNGEYLRRRHGATWDLSAGPLAPNEKADRDNAFTRTVNLFQPLAAVDDADATAGHGVSLEALVRGTDGRSLVLVNNATTADAALKRLTDPDLERGSDLLKKGQAEEGERVLLAMMDREAHVRNAALLFQVARLLYDQGRKEAARRLLERPAVREIGTAPLYNLLGLVQRDTDRTAAINSFKRSLRCDLHFGPAYLNLAEVFEKDGQRTAARLCLLRYLALMSAGPLADDALERIGRLETNGR